VQVGVDKVGHDHAARPVRGTGVDAKAALIRVITPAASTWISASSQSTIVHVEESGASTRLPIVVRSSSGMRHVDVARSHCARDDRN